MRTSIILLIFIALSLNTCRKNTTSFDRYTIKLQSESVGVTEAWLRLSVQPLTSEDRFVVKRDTHYVFRGRLNSQDTIISDLDLKPSTTYGYTAYREAEGQQAGKATTLDITTMDTTSHDFEWDIYEFGADSGGSSALYDVAIIDENDIWAVGEIHTSETDKWNEDSTKWIRPYNAVHWDGQEWELKYIYVDYRGKPNLAPLKGVFAMDDGKVIFSSGLPYLPTNNEWKLYHLWDMGILDENDGGVDNIWGTSLSNLYFAGRKGTIVHYNGNSWQRIESGTTQSIRDIWGVKDSVSGSMNIIAIASNIYQGGEIKVLRIDRESVINMSTAGLPWALDGIWFNKHHIYIGGDGLFKRNCIECSAPWQLFDTDLTNYFSHAIRGDGINMVVAGAFGEIITYNGMTWKNHLSDTYMSPGSYYAVDVKANLIVAVGHKSYHGYIRIGRRF
ncbi:MAG: hypothetical protein GF313_13570 [Caldithrix sp.]|nr:hypothetical protein [Caldithrix sp.]